MNGILDECRGAERAGWIPRVERNLANYLFSGTSSSVKTPVLPFKLCQRTSRLVGRAYAAAGQTGGALYTMAVLLPGRSAQRLGSVCYGGNGETSLA